MSEGRVTPVTARGTAAFRPRARLIRLIGSELISDEVMAVVELVKNAYDADARTVTVTLADVAVPTRTELVVEDDGDGMDLDTVLHSWLEPATGRKRRGGRKVRTALGRYPLGEKGVGRFAADKLGDRMELVTRARGGDEEIVLAIHWDRFGETGYLDEIEIDWQQRSPLTFPGHRHGTRIQASGVRGGWDVDRIVRLRDGLSRLLSPFSGMRDFRIVLQCPECPDLSGEITSDLVDFAPYQLQGDVDSVGRLLEPGHAGTPIDLRGLAHDRFVQADGFRQPFCGPFRVAFYAWDLDVLGPGRGIDRRMRAQLRRISGVSIYRDGFRVWPYGSAGDDWLELNQRRVNNPTMRFSTNQLVGVVEITQEGNPELQDRTSREGLIDNPAVEDLRALLIGALSLLEERRFITRKDLACSATHGDDPDPILAKLRALRAKRDDGTRDLRLVDEVIAEYRKQVERQDAVSARLIKLAGTGLSVEQVAAELRSTIGKTATGLTIARNRTGHEGVPEEVRSLVERLQTHVTFLEKQLGVIETLLDETESVPAFGADLGSALHDMAAVLEFRRRTGDISVSFELACPVMTSLARRDLLQVLVHLFDNALFWASRSGSGERPAVRVRAVEDPPGFIIADSGPGIPLEARENVFQVYFSRRSDGRGLGLYLVRTLLESAGGSVRVLPDPVLLSGANLQVALPPLQTRR